MPTPELKAWLDDVAVSVLGYYDTLLSTLRLSQDVIDRGIPGDLVECGVYAGAECAVMAKAIMLSGVSDRKVHLFDSFQGVPPHGSEDLEWVAANNPPYGASCPMVDVQNNMRRWGIPDELLIYHAGWFADTMPECGLERIALLRLDCDLYESTRACLQYLYPKVSHAGWTIVDDYPLTGCRKAMHETVMPQPVYFQKL